MPAFSNNIFNLRFYRLRQFWSKILITEFGLNIPKLKLTILPILSDDFIKNDSKRVNIRTFFRL
jgi:hypothetical protein